MEQRALTRREFLVLSGSGLVAAGALGPQAVLAQSYDYSTGVPDQYLGDADVLSAPLWRTREAWAQV